MKLQQHMSAEDARVILNRTFSAPRKALAAKPKQQRTKYKNHIVELDGMRFDSKAEYRHWCFLVLRAKAGEIADLRRQVPFELAPAAVYGGTKHKPMIYVADMTYTEGGKMVVVDVKGVRTDAYRLKRHLMATVHGIDIKEIFV